MSNVIITEEDDEIRSWHAPDVTMINSSGGYDGMLTAGQINEIQKQAYAEGYKDGKESGYRDGYKSGEEDLKKNIHYFHSMIKLLDEPLQELDESIVSQLVDLTNIIARQVIRRELRTDPGQIIAVVRECIKSLPIAARKVIIYLHPDDAMLVRGAFSIEENMEQSWQIVEDPVLTRGGCRIEAENSKIDMTVEQQLNRVIAQLLGGERKKDED